MNSYMGKFKEVAHVLLGVAFIACVFEWCRQLPLDKYLFFYFDTEIVRYLVHQFEIVEKHHVECKEYVCMMSSWPLLTIVIAANDILWVRRSFLKVVNSFVQANLVYVFYFCIRAFLYAVLLMLINPKIVYWVDRWVLSGFGAILYLAYWLMADDFLAAARKRYFPNLSLRKIAHVDRVITKLMFGAMLVFAIFLGANGVIGLWKNCFESKTQVTLKAKGPKGFRICDYPDCKIVGCEAEIIKQGTNVFYSPEKVSQFEKFRVGRTLKEDSRDEFRAGDKFEWNCQGKDWVFVYDGEHWHDADGDVADHEEIPFGLIDCATLTRESPDTTCISLNAAYRKL